MSMILHNNNDADTTAEAHTTCTIPPIFSENSKAIMEKTGPFTECYFIPLSLYLIFQF